MNFRKVFGIAAAGRPDTAAVADNPQAPLVADIGHIVVGRVVLVGDIPAVVVVAAVVAMLAVRTLEVVPIEALVVVHNRPVAVVVAATHQRTDKELCAVAHIPVVLVVVAAVVGDMKAGIVLKEALVADFRVSEPERELLVLPLVGAAELETDSEAPTHSEQ
jgi:hypothetical protein